MYKKIGELRGENGVIQLVLPPSYRKPPRAPPKTEPLSQEMHLNILAITRFIKNANHLTNVCLESRTFNLLYIFLVCHY
jgi:hypothetical protein